MEVKTTEFYKFPKTVYMKVTEKFRRLRRAKRINDTENSIIVVSVKVSLFLDTFFCIYTTFRLLTLLFEHTF